MARDRIATMLPSLEQFQLGDGGGPASLISRDAARFLGSSGELRHLVDLWFREEQEHSRLLGCAVRRFGGRLIRSHWSFTAFCACRRMLGVRFELQVLLLTEIVSTAYYRVLQRHADDQPVREMCSLILRDERGHVTFHLDRLVATHQAVETVPSARWGIQFWVCGHAAGLMLWVNHGHCLRALGATRQEYFREARFEIARFVQQLHARSVELRAEARADSPTSNPAMPAACG